MTGDFVSLYTDHLGLMFCLKKKSVDHNNQPDLSKCSQQLATREGRGISQSNTNHIWALYKIDHLFFLSYCLFLSSKQGLVFIYERSLNLKYETEGERSGDVQHEGGRVGMRKDLSPFQQNWNINVGTLIKLQAAPADTRMRVEAATEAARPLGWKGWSSKSSSARDVLGCHKEEDPRGGDPFWIKMSSFIPSASPAVSMLPTINRPVILHTRCFIYLDHDWGGKKNCCLCQKVSLWTPFTRNHPLPS